MLARSAARSAGQDASRNRSSRVHSVKQSAAGQRVSAAGHSLCAHRVSSLFSESIVHMCREPGQHFWRDVRTDNGQCAARRDVEISVPSQLMYGEISGQNDRIARMASSDSGGLNVEASHTAIWERESSIGYFQRVSCCCVSKEFMLLSNDDNRHSFLFRTALGSRPYIELRTFIHSAYRTL